MSDRRLTCLAICSTVAALALATALIYYNVVPIAPLTNRPLALIYLMITFNKYLSHLWAGSPEVVTSILWDYRGIDTVYETTVFFLAIIGSIALVRTLKLDPEKLGWGKGLTVVAKSVTRIVFAAIPVVAFSIAMHGHLTPGGGFQGGSAFAVAPLLALVALSLRLLVDRGWKKDRLLVLRTTGLLLVGFLALLTPLISLSRGYIAYILQNQPKPWSPTGLPPIISSDGFKALISGTLFWLNFSEFLAVSAGLALVFVLIAIPTSLIQEEVSRE